MIAAGLSQVSRRGALAKPKLGCRRIRRLGRLQNKAAVAACRNRFAARVDLFHRLIDGVGQIDGRRGRLENQCAQLGSRGPLRQIKWVGQSLPDVDVDIHDVGQRV